MAHKQDPRGGVSITNVGSWSSGTYLPMGAVVNRRTGHSWLWQIENNGAWHWQVGEHCRVQREGGPPGEGSPAAIWLSSAQRTPSTNGGSSYSLGSRFSTVPIALAVSHDGFEGAVAGLPVTRRAVRRPHEDNRSLPVIFNDYMKHLDGDPTTERLLPLITAAARAGVECFCIDSGWYTRGWRGMVGIGGCLAPFQEQVP